MVIEGFRVMHFFTQTLLKLGDKHRFIKIKSLDHIAMDILYKNRLLFYIQVVNLPARSSDGRNSAGLSIFPLWIQRTRASAPHIRLVSNATFG